MRIIAGEFKGRNIRSPPSLDVRPTSDRLRETLFNIIAPRIENARFLDLCAGSGAVGIEALSRGAAHTTFLERSRKICALIEANLSLCRVTDQQSEIYNSEASDFLKQTLPLSITPWDIVFYDPPYDDNYLKVLDILATNWAKLLTMDGMVVVEHFHKNHLPEDIGDMHRSRMLKQGDSSLSFYVSS